MRKEGRTMEEMVQERYVSVAQLAQELGWSYSKTDRMVSGRQEPTPREMRELSEVLGMESAEEITAVFHLL